MGKVQERIAAGLAAEVGSRVCWDEPPGLWFLYLQGGEAVLRHIDLPLFIWTLDRPPVVPSRLADGLGEFSGLLSSAAPEGLHGAAFYTETWTVAEPPAGTAERSELLSDSYAHRLHLRPDRVEARSMWAVDRAGITYGALLRRDLDKEPRTQVSATGPGRQIRGGVPAALERIVSAMLAVTMPGTA